jgi:hypothetical protein
LLRLLVGGAAALIIAAALVAPVVLRSGSSPSKTCARTFIFQGRPCVARHVEPKQFVQAIAVGVGVTSGCGASPSNVDLRSLAGVKPTVAEALATDQSSIYVRRGLCPASTSRQLLGCLRSSR